MARPLRLHVPGMLYHVIARGNNKQRIYVDTRDFESFLTLLGNGLERFSVQCLAYCLMHTHYHLLLKVGPHSVSRLRPIRKPLVAAHREDVELPRVERFAARPPLADIFRGVTDEAGRNRAAHLAHLQHGYTLKQIAAIFSRHPTTIARWVRRGSPST